MRWLIIACDGSDDDAPMRGLAARPAHLENASRLQAAGNLLIGDKGGMIGTAAVAQFRTRAELDDWLATDPYVTGNVWQNIEVRTYRVAPHYDVPPCPDEHHERRDDQ